MRISFFESEIKVVEIEKIVNFDKNFKSTKSLPSKINVLFLYSEKNNKNILICVDIIWLSSSLSNNLRLYLSKFYNTNIENISICASHTHGSLNTDENFTHGPVSLKFNEYLIKQIKDTVKKAFKNKKFEIYLELISKDIKNLSVNRRKLAPNYLSEFLFGKIGFWAQNFPNKYKYKNNKLISVNFRSKKNNNLLVTLIKFTCHPVADPPNCEGSDFPGYLKNSLSNYLKDKPMIFFLQGFAGDVRPNLLFKPKKYKDYILKLIIGDKFRESEKKDSKIIANEIVKQIRTLYKDINEKIYLNKINSYEKNKQILLIGEKKTNRKLNITIWDFINFKICFLSGEILSGYKLEWNKNKKVIGVGYSNGMTCYIPTHKDIKYGGYEVDKSRIKFNLKNRISKNFLNKLNVLLNDI